ncbi:cation:proton antiporter [Corynebacterium freiburgense]|uniref:cation:proton antiporter n=1 Tax=Corynebacterium freiburgense TaxID=556548 RepID=UPI0004280CB1|nr:cation:proton antiporter [Corynebacterium freiburgense]WJZ02040.1 glutathione-regulated potassium-efflux system protein KefC [Corynebacterium freiburgense]
MPEPLVLAAGASVPPEAIISMMWISIAALTSPLLSYLVRKKIPAVVFLLMLGVLIGPQVLGLAHADESNAMLRELGLGMLFLLAGWEINPDSMRGRQGKFAAGTWVFSAIFAFCAALVLFWGDSLAAVVIAVAVTSTAMGTLLPVIKTAGVSEPVSRGVLVHGAVGELGPIFTMALLLSTRSTWLTLIVLLVFMGGALIIAFVPRTVAIIAPWIGPAVRDGASHTAQTVMRAVIALLTVLMALAAVFELDVVLGAFAAGLILRALVPVRSRKTVEARLDVMGYGLLIPVFFITSGMAIEVTEVIRAPMIVLFCVVVILIARGLPIFLAERFLNTGSGLRTVGEQLQLGLYSATGLPIIVAVTEIALSRELIDAALGSILVASGAITVLLFPILAGAIPKQPKVENPDDKAKQEAAARAEDKEFRRAKALKERKTPKPQRPQSSTLEAGDITLD